MTARTSLYKQLSLQKVKKYDFTVIISLFIFPYYLTSVYMKGFRSRSLCIMKSALYSCQSYIPLQVLK